MNKKTNDDILDKLTMNGSIDDESEDDSKILIPKKCFQCNEAPICNALQTIASLSSIGIVLEITTCKYFVPTNKK